MSFPMNDDACYEFPIRLCPAYQQVMQDHGLFVLMPSDRLESIDDVLDALDILGTVCDPDGEEIRDDFYRLCRRIEAQYRAAQRY